MVILKDVKMLVAFNLEVSVVKIIHALNLKNKQIQFRLGLLNVSHKWFTKPVHIHICKVCVYIYVVNLSFHHKF